MGARGSRVARIGRHGRDARNSVNFGGFSPTQLSGLVLWLRADLGITLNGGNVSAWADQSGTGDANKNVTQGTAANQPLYVVSDAAYNGKPTLDLNGSVTTRWMSSGIWSAAPTTVGTTFVVGAFGNAGVEVLYNFSNSAPGELYLNGVNDLRYFQGVDLIVVGEVTVGSKHIYCVERNGASSKVYQDNITALTTGDAGSSVLSQFHVGANSDAGGGASLVAGTKFAETIDYNRILTLAERTQVLNYLGARYGVTVGP